MSQHSKSTKKITLKLLRNFIKKILKVNPNHFESTFLLGSLSAQIKNFDKAKQLIDQAIKINPNHADAYNNLGNVLKELGKFQKAINSYEKAIKINPNHADAYYNLGIVLKELGKFQKAINSYEKAIKINPNHADAYYNLGIVLKELGKFQKAISSYEKAIKINPNHADAYYNLGIVLKELGKLQKAINSYEKAIKINPNNPEAYNNLGNVLQELGNCNEAKKCFEKAIELNPNYANAYWNLHSFAPNIDEALKILKQLYKVNNKFIKAKIMISALKYLKGNFNDFDTLISSPESNHPLTRSIKWVFSLPQLPKIFSSRWEFFDAVVALTDQSRPFYEFGVWNGVSFQYLINTYKKGFGFDTFTGLPESWDGGAKGSYSSFGSVPKISGGKFIVGEFKKTLPKFFSKKRPLASLINFDADLYSSTFCALNHSYKVIDEKNNFDF